MDKATQEILEIAAEVDPEGRRTLGVLTKPDVVDHGAEPTVVDLIEGRAHAIRLGWHLVRDPGQNQLADENTDRDVLETAFFRDSLPWKAWTEKNRVEMNHGDAKEEHVSQCHWLVLESVELCASSCGDLS